MVSTRSKTTTKAPKSRLSKARKNVNDKTSFARKQVSTTANQIVNKVIEKSSKTTGKLRETRKSVNAFKKAGLAVIANNKFVENLKKQRPYKYMVLDALDSLKKNSTVKSIETWIASSYAVKSISSSKITKTVEDLASSGKEYVKQVGSSFKITAKGKSELDE